MKSINKSSTFYAAQTQGRSVSDGRCDNQNKHLKQKKRNQQNRMAGRDKATRQLEEYKEAKKVNCFGEFFGLLWN